MRWINFNMGCIETRMLHIEKTLLCKINFNMGCIETINIVGKCYGLDDKL